MARARALVFLSSYLDAQLSFIPQWHPEVKHFCPKVPVLLVGCKKDLRDDPKTKEELGRISQHPVTSKEVLFILSNIVFALLISLLPFALLPPRPLTINQGEIVAQKIGAKQYLECSAKTGEGVHGVFHYATRFALLQIKKPKLLECIVV